MRRIATRSSPSLLRGLVDQRLDGGGDLILAGAALWAARRSVREDGHAAKPHRGRLIDDRYGLGGRREIVEARVRAVLLHYIKVYGRDSTVGPKPNLDAALEPARADPMKYSSCRDTRIITGRPIFFAISAGITISG